MKHKLFVFNLLVIVLMLFTALAGCGPQAAEAPPEATAPPEAAGPVEADFVVWSYGIETIQDNIKNFQELNPDISITLKDYSWLDYPDTMVGLFTAGGAPELLYDSDPRLTPSASAGGAEPVRKTTP